MTEKKENPEVEETDGEKEEKIPDEEEEMETVKGGSDNSRVEKKSDEEEEWFKSQEEEEEKECEDETQGEEGEEVGKEENEDEQEEREMEEEDVDEEKEQQDREIMEGKVEEAKVEGLKEHHTEKEEEVNKEEEEQVNGKEEETEEWAEELSEEPEKRPDQSDPPKRSPPSALQDPEVSESLSHDTENKAPRDLADGEKGAVTAKTHSGDIYPTSPSSDKEAFLSSTDALSQTAAAAQSVTDTNLPCADAHLNLSEQTEESERSVQEQERHPGETAGEEEAGHSRDTAPELHTELQTSLCRPEDKVTLMDAPAQSSMEDGQESKNSSSTGNPAMDVTGGKVKKDSAERSPVMNGEADAADDSKKSSKYKTVSYRKIPRGNTKQRIDEFESMFNS